MSHISITNIDVNATQHVTQTEQKLKKRRTLGQASGRGQDPCHAPCQPQPPPPRRRSRRLASRAAIRSRPRACLPALGSGSAMRVIALVFFVRVISSVSRACAISLHVLSYISLVFQHTLALSLFIRTKLSWSNFLWTRQLVQSRVRLAPFTRSMRSMPCAATSVPLP